MHVSVFSHDDQGRVLSGRLAVPDQHRVMDPVLRPSWTDDRGSRSEYAGGISCICEAMDRGSRFEIRVD